MSTEYSIREVTKLNLDSIIQFLLLYEEACVSLMSRVLKLNNSFNTKEQKVYCVAPKNESISVSNIQGVFLITSSGIVLHHILFCPSKDLKILLKNKNLFSLAGCAKSSDIIEKALSCTPSHIIDYYLMENTGLRTEKYPLNEKYESVLCQKGDEKGLFRLQKNYHFEEVLPPGKSFSDKACLQILQNRLEEYMVFAIREKNNNFFVSMAGTNAIGKNCVQLGGIYTAENFRNRGFAQFLVHTLVSNLNKKVVLFVRKNNVSAITAYKKNSFTIIDSYKICYI